MYVRSPISVEEEGARRRIIIRRASKGACGSVTQVYPPGHLPRLNGASGSLTSVCCFSPAPKGNIPTPFPPPPAAAAAAGRPPTHHTRPPPASTFLLEPTVVHAA
ncbi:hypothetical protein CIRG_00944 [Coccidioides immitis RMSCC 2394]|uniref:Uncharacterized protein n=1 Tax=Coccidioides immitis RMSCC 2394 TaxID=404692 RepID=A0A0J7AU25_COCIT|nr:hypothetical protein CIRG_00944 [Coccidioides immitis RMSCC 2394]